ncbi:hypothetical protein HTVC168P_gp42 [Pelagibacter phage HTVC168P]|nr:hypothetical protein HTVC168P_gp42 [Pelagibacter phage HTVC168P]
MAITYEWSFPNFECDSSNVVKTIHWRYTATDSETDAEGNAYVSSMYGSCAGSEGMNFDSMTKEHCENCVLENQDTTIEDMQSNLSAQIEEQKAPALTSKTKEW